MCGRLSMCLALSIGRKAPRFEHQPAMGAGAVRPPRSDTG